jgi:hypothetical protein
LNEARRSMTGDVGYGRLDTHSPEG